MTQLSAHAATTPAAANTIALRGVAFLLILLGVIRIAGVVPGAPLRNDFSHYYLGARILLEGGDPYTTPLEPICKAIGVQYDPWIPFASNPPLLLRVVSLVAWMPISGAYSVWGVLQVGALLALIAAARAAVGYRLSDNQQLFFLALVVNSTALLNHLYFSQVQLLIAAVVAWAYVAHLKGRNVLACSAVALAAAFKIYPVILLPWFLCVKLQGKRDFAQRLLGVAAMAAAVLLWTGVESWVVFVTQGLDVIERSVTGSSSNFSLQAVATTLVYSAYNETKPEVPMLIARVIGIAAALGMIVASYGVIARRNLRPMAPLALLTIATMMASSVCWAHYYVLLILPAAGMIAAAGEIEDVRSRRVLYLLATLCLMPALDVSTLVAGASPARWAIHYYPVGIAFAAWLWWARPVASATNAPRPVAMQAG